MAFGKQSIIPITLLWVAWACVLAQTTLMLVPQRGRIKRHSRGLSVWGWGLTAAFLLLYLFLGHTNFGVYDLLDSHARFVALCEGYILALGRVPRESDRAKEAKIASGVAVALVGAAAAWSVGEASNAGPPMHLGLPFYALSDAVLSAAVGMLAFAVVSEWTRLRKAVADRAADGLASLSGAIITWAMITAWAALLLGGIGTFMTKGALWSWDPVELWRLSLALLYSLLAHGKQRPASGLRRALTYLIALAFSLFVLFGVHSLVRLLGLPSRFVS
jgi:hypothetical protein